jgi:mono/diheme cytochrome c family protein
MSKVAFLTIGLLVLSPMVMAQGQALHDAACIQCHASLTGGKPTSMYTRADRKVTTLVSLQQQVKGCAIAADANWSDDERASVVKYLSTAFYGF